MLLRTSTDYHPSAEEEEEEEGEEEEKKKKRRESISDSIYKITKRVGVHELELVRLG